MQHFKNVKTIEDINKIILDEDILNEEGKPIYYLIEVVEQGIKVMNNKLDDSKKKYLVKYAKHLDKYIKSYNENTDIIYKINCILAAAILLNDYSEQTECMEYKELAIMSILCCFDKVESFQQIVDTYDIDILQKLASRYDVLYDCDYAVRNMENQKIYSKEDMLKYIEESDSKKVNEDFMVTFTNLLDGGNKKL